MKQPLLRRSVLAVLLISLVLTIHAPQAPAETTSPADAKGPCPTLFSDVGPGHPFCEAIADVTFANLVDGFPDGTFRPASYVTREALAAWIYRLAESPWGPDPVCLAVPFSDVGSSAFCGEIEWAASVGLVHGFPGGTFRPTGFVTRQAAAAIFFNVFTEFLVPPCDTPPFTDVPTTHRFCGEIAWFLTTGFSTGYPDGSYRPAALVTRQAAAAWLGFAHSHWPAA